MEQDEIDTILKNAISGNIKPQNNTTDQNMQGESEPQKTDLIPEVDVPKSPATELTMGRNNIDLLLDVPLEVSVELGRTRMTIKDMLQLGPGSVIELDKLIGEPVDLLVNDNLIARGEVVVFEENFGIRVTDIITPEDRVRSLR